MEKLHKITAYKGNILTTYTVAMCYLQTNWTFVRNTFETCGGNMPNVRTHSTFEITVYNVLWTLVVIHCALDSSPIYRMKVDASNFMGL